MKNKNKYKSLLTAGVCVIVFLIISSSSYVSEIISTRPTISSLKGAEINISPEQLPLDNDDYSKAYNEGKNLDLSNEQIISLATLFQSEIALTYKNLGETRLAKRQGSKLTWTEYFHAFYDLKSAESGLRNAQMRLLKSSGLDEKNIQKYTINSYYNPVNLSVYVPISFRFFLAGLFRRVNLYISFNSLKVTKYGENFEVIFPEFDFSKESLVTQTQIPADVTNYFSTSPLNPSFQQLHDFSKIKLKEITLYDSTFYTIDGIANTSGFYGELDKMEAEPIIFINEKNILDIPILNEFPDLQAAAINNIRIHEISHYRYKYKCKKNDGTKSFKMGDSSLSERELDEAQAITTSIGFFASKSREDLRFVLVQNYQLGRNKNYSLINETFFDALIIKNIEKEFQRLLDGESNGYKYQRSELPSYMNIGTETTFSTVAPKNAKYLGTLSISGKKSKISAVLDQLEYIDAIHLLYKATPSEVTDAAQVSLKQIINKRNLLCN
jgi:PKD repeat protein